jgi:hypothetical protein
MGRDVVNSKPPSQNTFRIELKSTAWGVEKICPPKPLQKVQIMTLTFVLQIVMWISLGLSLSAAWMLFKWLGYSVLKVWEILAPPRSSA